MSRISRKHFQTIANAMRAVKPVQADALQVWYHHVLELAHMCDSLNPDFDNEKFLLACGYHSGEYYLGPD